MNKKRKWLAFFCIVILNIFFLCACTPTMDNSNGKVDDEEGFVIACLGDSITEGVGVDNEEERYTVLLEQDEAISSVQNVGFSGSFVGYTNKTEHAYIDTYSFLKRYKNIKNLTDLIFVFGGTNDYLSLIHI